ncbi:hypothetical protein B0A50_02171 [Salinomyces thailandicus]|uniref:Uncharacterized protein n=1 Tax=Salinomyces thailandicus TaxID=706561 RepID=A0A4U0UA54_9PEZI|nr:hypothetical protein B0A50_02171 [Salinomyces thailandica]
MLRRASIAAAAAPASALQHRSLFGWGKGRYDDWASPLDPSYQRYARYHTLKSRAKLLKSLKRRSKFEWDVNQRPFFTPRHIRFASHWNSDRPGSPWNKYAQNQAKDRQDRRDQNPYDEAEGEGYELTQREKEWKERMEFMRKRIERDPYEAVFGKRFEPFWSPLVPSWMREQMGLPGWDREKVRGVSSKAGTPQKSDASMENLKKDLESKTVQAKHHSERVTEPAPVNAKRTSSEVWPGAKAEAAPKAVSSSTTSPQNFASYNATSWNSWSNKTRRTEWDSATGLVKRFEYDPISNRYVQIEGPQASTEAAERKLETAESEEYKNALAQQTPKSKGKEAAPPLPARSGDMRSLINTPSMAASRKSNLQSDTSRPSVPADGVPKTHSALANLPKDDLDLLTADNVRASMGKIKQQAAGASRSSTPTEKAAMKTRFDNTVSEHDAEVEDIIRDRELAKYDKRQRSASEWDQAEEAVLTERELQFLKEKKAKLLRDERGLYHIERVKKAIAKLDGQIGKVEARLRQEMAVSQEGVDAILERDDIDLEEKLGAISASTPSVRQHKPAAKLQTSLDRSAAADKETSTLRPAIDRLQRKPLEDLDDSAAHESTEPLSAPISNAVPQGWSDAADRLQADRVWRTTGKQPYPMAPRWIDDMNARKAAWKNSRPTPSQEEMEKKAKVEKANTLLEKEVAEQKVRMQAHEAKVKNEVKMDPIEKELSKLDSPSTFVTENKRIKQLESELLAAKSAAVHASTGKSAEAAIQGERKYIEKIRSLRTELDMAYKQSSFHADEYVQRIQGLEAELGKYKNSPILREHDIHGSTARMPATVKVASGNAGAREESSKYMEKIKGLRKELDMAFKQSAVQGEKHVERIRYLESELSKARKASSTLSKPAGLSQTAAAKTSAADTKIKEVQAEGDFDPKICKFAADSEKWYKQPSCPPQPSKLEIEQAEQRVKNQKVKEIYEKEYGVLGDRQHQNSETAWPRSIAAETTQAKSAATAKEATNVHDDVHLGKALAKHEKGADRYAYHEDGLAAEIDASVQAEQQAKLALQESESRKTQALMAPESSGKMRSTIAQELQPKKAQEAYGKKIVDDAMPKLIPTEISKKAVSKSENTPIEAGSGVQWEEWQEPPLYKVLAYDSGNDKFSTAETTANFFGNETAISIPEALSKLYQPARFVPHFAELQREGYQAIYGTRDLLVFKKVMSSSPAPAKQADAAFAQASLVDHGLIKPKENSMAEDAANYYEEYGSKSEKTYDPTSVENGKLMPYENAMAQEAAQAYDHARKYPPINPIDGTSGSTHITEVSTGNFASTTGFVNHDPVFSSEDSRSVMDDNGGATVEGATTELKSARDQEKEDEYKHYPRVRREEAVFSGSRRKWNDRQERHHRRSQQEQQRNRSHRKPGGGLVAWVFKVGVGAAAVSYVIGVAAEYSRQDRRERERWQQILEGKRGRLE